MSRWKALPAELDPRIRQLVVRLRRLKDHSGLSVRQLAARTEYSPKSWERYLGARSLPPAPAVEALAKIAGDDPVRLLALREVAAEAWENRRADPAHEPDQPESPKSPDSPDELAVVVTPSPAHPTGVRSLHIALVAGAVALVLALSSAVLLAVRLHDDETTKTAPASRTAPTSSAPAAQPAYTCRLKKDDGHWFAGLGRSWDVNLAYGNAGADVAEAQCLLRRAGISPGGIDGIFGPLTQRAVKELQKRAGLVVDGVIGPHTWKALRG
ncbi:peptidoglycan-binding protein [Streptomyces pseudovenezuelae]|nr:peptidoglycan-binding protein [Streptomyces pseudovenezuelae]